MDLHKLQQHPLCARMNEKHPLTRIGVDSHVSGSAEESALSFSVAKFGPRRRIVIDADTGQVLDGWNFLQAYLKAQDVQHGALEPLDGLIELREFDSERDKALFVIGLQIGRRNLSAAQRSALTKDFLQPRDGGDSSPSVESIAEMSGTDRRTVLRVNKIDREGAPELAAGLRSGAVPMESAEALLSKSKAEQAAIISAGPEAVAEVRREAVEARDARRGRETSVPWSREATPDDMAGLARSSRGATEAAGASSEPEATHAATGPQDAPAATSSASGHVSLEEAWRNATSGERRSLVVNHSAELRAILAQAFVKANGVKFDKTEAWQKASKLQRDMPRNAEAMAVCEALKQALGYVP